MVVAIVALVFAVAGTSIAATQIGNNSIGAQELAKVVTREETAVVDSQVNNHGDATAECKANEQRLAGGTAFEDAVAADFADVNYSAPVGKGGWTGGGYVDDSETDDYTLVVSVICLKK